MSPSDSWLETESCENVSDGALKDALSTRSSILILKTSGAVSANVAVRLGSDRLSEVISNTIWFASFTLSSLYTFVTLFTVYLDE